MLLIPARRKTNHDRKSSGCGFLGTAAPQGLSMREWTCYWGGIEEGKKSSMSVMDQNFFDGISTSVGFVCDKTWAQIVSLIL